MTVLKKLALPVGLALVAASCQDLDVVNPNRPDAERGMNFLGISDEHFITVGI